MYYFSNSKSQHAQDTDNEVLAAVTVHSERSCWQDIHGLQMCGAITAVQSHNKWQEAWKLYQAKFPFAADLEQLVALNQPYVFNPYWNRVVDNRRGFGFNLEWGRSEPDRVGETCDLIIGKDRNSGGVNG